MKNNLFIRKTGSGVYLLCTEEGEKCVCFADCGCSILYKLIGLLFNIADVSSSCRVVPLGNDKFFVLLPTCPLSVSRQIFIGNTVSDEFCDFARWVLES